MARNALCAKTAAVAPFANTASIATVAAPVAVVPSANMASNAFSVATAVELASASTINGATTVPIVTILYAMKVTARLGASATWPLSWGIYVLSTATTPGL